jgi:hypothetical protein
MMQKAFGIFIFILIFSGIFITCYNAYSVAVLPQEKTVGTQETVSIDRYDIIIADKPTTVTLKGRCPFVLINLENNEVYKADISIQNKDDINNMYQIPNAKLNGKYEFQYSVSSPLDQCFAQLYSDKPTKITIDYSIYTDGSYLGFYTFVALLSTAFVAFLIIKISHV